MAAELTCGRRTRKIVEENDEQILLFKENKKENGVGTHLVPKEDMKDLYEPERTIFHLLTDKIGCK